MMNSQPSSPIGTRFRQRQVGEPYRDDPEAPPHLQAYTRGGLGPDHSSTSLSGKDKSGSMPLQCLNMFRGACRLCNPAVTDSTDGSVYYIDHFNDLPVACSVGTTDDDGVWLNRSDPAGTMMSCLVWFLIGYSAVTMTFLAHTEGIPLWASTTYAILAALALSTHVKTTLTDPGSVPASAVPTHEQRSQQHSKLSMCSQCQTFKPPHSHHCRICNRCISRMDHHCPWMNNCVGAGNLKHFLLFLCYTWTCSVFALLVLGYNYFFCSTQECMFNLVLTQLVRVMTFLSLGAFLFTSSMLMNVTYGIMTGIGTIDRLKKKATGTMADSEEDSIPFQNIFGVGPYYTWPLPTDPIFPDYDKVMGFSTPQRLLREQMREGHETGSVVSRDSYSYGPG